MKMYVWRSNALEAYGKGTLIAIGVDVDEARTNLRALLKREFSDYDEDFKDELEDDLRQVPEEKLAHFIWGSD